MCDCRTLNTEEICSIYQQHLIIDFPKEECKPLARIINSLQKQEYLCFGFFEDNTLCGYAFFVQKEKNGKMYLLLDYFAVCNGMRGQGIGSEFLHTLHAPLHSFAEMVLCEAEHPLHTTGEEYQTRTRRIRFYQKNDFIDTNVTAEAFGVRFVLLEWNLRQPHPQEEVRAAYSLLYRTVLPQAIYDKHIRID